MITSENPFYDAIEIMSKYDLISESEVSINQVKSDSILACHQLISNYQRNIQSPESFDTDSKELKRLIYWRKVIEEIKKY